MMPLTTSALSLVEYRAGARAARFHLTKRAKHQFLWFYPVAGCTLALCALTLYLVGIRFDRYETVLIVFAVVLCLQFLFPFWTKKADATDYKRGGWSKPISVVFDESALHLTLPIGVTVTYPWGLVSEVLVADGTLVLLTKSQWLMFPRRIFSDSDWQQLHNFVGRKEILISC